MGAEDNAELKEETFAEAKISFAISYVSNGHGGRY